jgi:nitroreductase
MHDTHLLEFLKSRRSAKVTALAGPGPTRTEIDTILEIGARVPDHGKYAPWFFIVIEGEARRAAGEYLRAAYEAEDPDAPAAKLDLEAERFMRAPLVIAVVSRIKYGKHRQWEQLLSAGAVCYNICLAAQSLGYGATWLTEWYAYSAHFKAAAGLDGRDHFAGFIYIGMQETRNEERDRPEISQITNFWDPSHPLRKGDEYGNIRDLPPEPGFILT